MASITDTPTTPVPDAGPDMPGGPPLDAEPRPEPIWRVVGGSIIGGLLASIVLSVVVFGGAEEHVVSGSALLAFASGWAMLATLSARWTSQPQRWARVPAVFMAVAGATLLVARPGDRALDTAGWVWPPVVLALAVWMGVQVRRNLSSRARWLVLAVVASVAVGAVGGMYETASRARDRDDYPAPGTLYDVGGRRLHLDCTGSGSPTVVLVNGLGGVSAMWSRVVTDVERTTRVCAYDRAGQGWSDDVATHQDGLAIAADLHTLLARADESGPFVLVLLDSMSPDEFTDLPGFATEQSMMSRGLGVLTSLTRLGAARVLPTSAWSSLPEPAASQVESFSASARGMRNMRDEQSMYPVVFEQAGALRSLHGKPLVVVTATESVQEHGEWVGVQQRLAALSTNSDHRVVDATHAGLIDDGASFEASVLAVVDVVTSVRTGQATRGTS